MKSFAVLLGLFFSCLEIYAQSYAVVHTENGFINIRAEKSSTSKIVGKVANCDIVGCDLNDKSSWVNIYKTFSEKRNEPFVEGYVERSKIIPLSEYKHLKSRSNGHSFTATNDSLTIVIRSAAFAPQKHKLLYEKPSESNAPILLKIDHKNIWGTDGGVPKRMITSISFVNRGVKVSIPLIAYHDLYEPNFDTAKVYLGCNKAIYVQMNNSDGAGGYSVIWIIKNNKYLKRYLDDSNA